MIYQMLHFIFTQYDEGADGGVRIYVFTVCVL